MQVQSLTRPINAAEIPLDRLARSSELSDAEKVSELTRQFEAILVRQILQEAQTNVFPTKLNPETPAKTIYQDLITNQLADNISHSGTLGLAETLTKQLTRQLAAEAKNPSPSSQSQPESPASATQP
jgi:Rod binding domain-containing protein